MADMKSRDWIFHLIDDDRALVRRLSRGVSARILFSERVMLSLVQLDADSEAPIHSHQEEQWGMVLEGSCVRIQGGEQTIVAQGDCWYTPGGVSHGIRADRGRAVILDIFSPPRSDYARNGHERNGRVSSGNSPHDAA